MKPDEFAKRSSFLTGIRLPAAPGRVAPPRNRWRLAFAFALVASLVPFVAFAQTAPPPKTILVDIFPYDDLGQIVGCACSASSSIVKTYLDPDTHPWSQLTVTFAAAYEINYGPANVSVFLNGQQVGSSQDIFNVQGPTFCDGQTPYTFTAPSMLPGYHVGGQNTLEIKWVGSMCWGALGSRDAVLTFTYPPPPPPLEFEITDKDAEDDRRVLLSNTHVDPFGTPTYPYPRYQALLGRDGVIPVNLRVNSNGAPVSGVPVELRITDPADTSEYIAGGPGIVQQVPGTLPNGGPLPTLAGTGVTANADGSYSATSGANGLVSTELHLTPRTNAGDNYRVTAKVTFPDSGVATGTSGVITAWKRIFVEKRPMFRSGAPLATDAPAGVTNLIVRNEHINSVGQDFRHNDHLFLIHAPLYGEPKIPASYHLEFAQVGGHPASFTAADPQPGPGSITTNGTTSVTGSHAHFNNLQSGDVISINDDHRYVISVQNNDALTIDTPFTFIGTTNQTNPPTPPYMIGDPNLIDHGRRAYLRLPLSAPLARNYLIQPPARLGREFLNDTVARITAPTLPVSPLDYFGASDSLIGGTSDARPYHAFASAYTEYIVLPWEPVSGTGDIVPRAILSSDPNNKIVQKFIDKWFGLPIAVPVDPADPSFDPSDRLTQFRYPALPNHQLLLVGDSDVTDFTRVTGNGFLNMSVFGERASVLNRGVVEYAVGNRNSPLYGADPEVILPRTSVHELTHQWFVNDAVFGHFDHCVQEVAYTSQAAYPTSSSPPAGIEFCLMSDSFTSPIMLAPWDSNIQVNMVQYYYRFGLIHYHMDTGRKNNSEYLGIRAAPDPWSP